MKTMGLFAGDGGALYADLILGHAPICAVEIEKHCCAVLRARKAEWWPQCDIIEGDVRAFDPAIYAGRVDCLHAGFPCQDISLAGGGAGIAGGERSGLWSEVRRVASVVRPRYIFLENSPAIVSRGLDIVLGDLAALGYDARWCVLSAAAVGAPHRRERWWCLATDTDQDDGKTRDQQQGRRSVQRESIIADGGCHVANAMQVRCRASRQQKGPAPDPSPRNSDVANSVQERCQQPGLQPTESAQPHKTIEAEHGSPMADTMCYGLANGLYEGRPGEATGEAGEALEGHGGDWWAAEPDVGRVAHGVAHRRNRIAALGNGQVPLCAAAAWVYLGGPMT